MIMSGLTNIGTPEVLALALTECLHTLQSPMSPLCRGDVRRGGCGDAVRPCYGFHPLVPARVSGQLCVMKDPQRSRKLYVCFWALYLRRYLAAGAPAKHISMQSLLQDCAAT